MYLASKTNYLNLFSWAGEGREEGRKKDDGKLLVLHLHLHFVQVHTYIICVQYNTEYIKCI